MAEIGRGGLSIVPRTVARWIEAFAVVFGIYLLGLAGGVLIALAFVLITLCYGKQESLRMFPLPVAGSLASIGALAFLAIALAGMAPGLGGAFFTNFIEKAGAGAFLSVFSSGTIPLNELAITIAIGSLLFVLFMTLLMFRMVHPSSKDESE